MPLAVFTSVTVTLAPVAYVRLWHLLHLAVFISSTVILALDAPGSVHICHCDSGTCCLCSPLAPAAPSSVHIFHCDFGTWCPWQCSHLSRLTLNLAPTAPGSVHIWHPMLLAVFTSVTVTLAPAAPGSVHTGLYDWHQVPMPFTTFHWLCTVVFAPPAFDAVNCMCCYACGTTLNKSKSL